ncbi:hypothetical protein [Streptomyces shenzhenensis]|uniref:hypothetical protein n=1 Tax=Streptomyces shenzhenensis TaxID=943815 RepID=UPI0036CCF30F
MTVDKGGGAARAEADRFYLCHGRYPDDAEPADRGEPPVPAQPPSPYSERPVARVRLGKARELVERLLAEGHVRFDHADDEEIAEWRRVVNYAKRHGMEPVGKRIEKVSYGRLGLEFFLAEGPHPNARSQRPKTGASVVRVPTRLVSLRSVAAALKDHARQLVMPPALHRRSLPTALASDAIIEGGRGIMGERQVERFLRTVGSGVEAAREGQADPTRLALSEVSRYTVPDVSRRMSTLMAAMWQGSGRSLSEFPANGAPPCLPRRDLAQPAPLLSGDHG